MTVLLLVMVQSVTSLNCVSSRYYHQISTNRPFLPVFSLNAQICSKCKLPGATLSCIYKSCTVSPLHYLCAKDKGNLPVVVMGSFVIMLTMLTNTYIIHSYFIDCDLDEEKFILSCSKHKVGCFHPAKLGHTFLFNSLTDF